MDVFLKENERIDDLELKNLKIIQNKSGFCFGMDSVLIANFAKKIKKGSKVLDLGTGTGIIGILLCGKTQVSKIVGVEIQEEVANMAKRSIKLNHLEEKFEIIIGDIKQLENKEKKDFFDAIITNPPYKKENEGLKNKNVEKIISRHEVKANLEDFIKAGVRNLKDKGEFYMVHRPERIVDIAENLRKYKLEPKEIQFVYPNINKGPTMVLVKAVKNAKPFLKVLKPIIIYNLDGTYTNEILEIYNKN